MMITDTGGRHNVVFSVANSERWECDTCLWDIIEGMIWTPDAITLLKQHKFGLS